MQKILQVQHFCINKGRKTEHVKVNTLTLSFSFFYLNTIKYNISIEFHLQAVNLLIRTCLVCYKEVQRIYPGHYISLMFILLHIVFIKQN